MKKYLIISVLSMLAFTSSAAEKEVEVSSTVKAATVYLQGAQLQRQSDVTLSSGITKLVFNNLEAGIYSNSIQVSGNGNFTIMDVQYLSKYIETGAKVNNAEIQRLKKRITILEDSILDLNFELEEVNAMISTLNTEKNLLLNNPITKGTTVGDSLDLLMDAVEYLRPQLNAVNKSIIVAKKGQHKINKSINKVNAKLSDLRNLLNQQNNNSRTTKLDYRVVVTVLSEQAAKGKITLKYYINNAGWTPIYDIRATDLDAPVRLSLKGQVYQNTGKNWEDVKLTISTKNAGENSQKPNLSAWYINLMNGAADYQPTYGNIQMLEDKEVLNEVAISAGRPRNKGLTDSKREDLVRNSSSFTTVQRQIISEEYEINLKYDIPSDGQRHMVILKHDDLEADFKYYAVPKADQHAYLMARIGNLGEVNILNAQANIYYSDTYIGQVTLNPAYFSDTLAISMGKDRNVRVTRTLAGERCKVKTLGSSAEKTVYYNYQVHNLNKRKIDLVVEDNIPISTNGDIKVEILTEDGDFKHTPNSGKIEWKFSLAPNQIENFELGFEIKYPKDMQISGI